MYDGGVRAEARLADLYVPDFIETDGFQILFGPVQLLCVALTDPVLLNVGPVVLPPLNVSAVEDGSSALLGDQPVGIVNGNDQIRYLVRPVHLRLCQAWAAGYASYCFHSLPSEGRGETPSPLIYPLSERASDEGAGVEHTQSQTLFCADRNHVALEVVAVLV